MRFLKFRDIDDRPGQVKDGHQVPFEDHVLAFWPPFPHIGVAPLMLPEI